MTERTGRPAGAAGELEGTAASGSLDAERGDVVVRLLELGGDCEEPRPARLLRLRETVRPHWRRRVRRRRAAAAGMAFAAAAALLSILAPSLRSRLAGWLPAGAEATPAVASVEAVVGEGLRWSERGARGVELAVGSAVHVGQTIESGAARVALRLEANTAARIDRASRVRFLGQRRVELQAGAIYVDTGEEEAVARSAGVEVVTPLGVVEDIGTRFEVRLDGDALVLRVRDGAVLLHHGRGTYEGRAGEELRLIGSSTLRRRPISSADPSWAWTVEVSVAPGFDGARLEEVLAWAAHETGSAVRYRDRASQARAERAVVRGDVAGLAVPEVLEAVLPVSGLSHRLEGETLIVESTAGGGGAR